jgi:FAD/FMN-containing dehydrogenase
VQAMVLREVMRGAVAAGAIRQLEERLVGEVVYPDSIGYDEVRRTQNVEHDRYPAMIVRARSAADVARTVTFARAQGLQLAVRSGGHSLAGHGMVDNAVVVDLAQMKRVVVEPEARIARVQAGATSGDLVAAAGEHGLALSTGDTASVGMGGLVTGGGIGFLVRKHGLTIDSLVSAQVVTADGDIVTASAAEHADLFWAIRGGGGNFGIVTEFTFRLVPTGLVLGGVLFLPASREVIRGYLDCAEAAPDELTTIANLCFLPPAPFVPQERVGELVLAVLVCWTGEIAEGERALAPLRALATPVADMVGPIPYPVLYQFTAHQSAPHASAFRSMFADDLSDAAIDAALAAFQHPSTPFSVLQLRVLGGAMARVGNDATAFGHRNARYLVAAMAAWMDPAEDAAPHRAWVAALWQTISPEGTGAYANFLGDEGAERIKEAYPAPTLARLASIKRRYDPGNLFRFNQNILPAE